jgi:acetylornithine deacetylase
MAHATQLSSTELLAQLVAFDTTSSRPNLPLIQAVAAYLDQWGVRYRIMLDPDGRRANLHAVIGPQTEGGIALSGHVDTVPVEGQNWTADPFTLRRSGGRLYGRGTTDMKGFVACCLAAVPTFMAARLTRPLHLLITYDEEVTFEGARRMIDTIARDGWRPDLCIVGEASSMKPIIAHKGKLSVRARVRGRPGHSSVPAQGVNALVAAARAVVWLTDEAGRRSAAGPFAHGFEPPTTTAHVGLMSAGTILNIIPDHAVFDLEWRTVPGDEAHRELARLREYVATNIEPGMHAVDPATGFDFEVALDLPHMALPEDHELAGLVREITGANAVGRVSYGTEGGFYQAAGIPSIVCGPGNIAQAHQPDEWIAESELDACDAFLRALPAYLAS